MQKLTLKKPIKVGDTEITVLNFRDEAVANDLIVFDAGGANEQNIKLIANLTGSDVEIIGQLKGADYIAADTIATKIIGEFAKEKNA